MHIITNSGRDAPSYNRPAACNQPVPRAPNSGTWLHIKVNESAIRVINGKEEGAFLWLSVNYLLWRFKPDRSFMFAESSLMQKRKHFKRVSIEVWYNQGRRVNILFGGLNFLSKALFNFVQFYLGDLNTVQYRVYH